MIQAFCFLRFDNSEKSSSTAAHIHTGEFVANEM